MLKYTICQRNRAAGSRVWYLRTFDTETKKISFQSLGTEKKAEAAEALNIKNAERFKSQEEKRLEHLPTLDRAISEWIEHIERGNAGTYRNYINKIPFLREYCSNNGIEKITDFTTRNAVELITQLPKENTARTVINKKRVYSTLFNWIYTKYGIEKINPFQRVKTQKAATVEREFWTPQQIDMILDAASDPGERLLFAFMAFAGLRFSEAMNIHGEQIDGHKIKIIGKGGKFAIVPIGNRMKQEIALYIDGGGSIQAGRIFKRIRNQVANPHLRKICEKLGFSGYTHCHKFRHSFISNLLLKGGSIVAVSKLARHETPDITLRFYAHCLPDNIENTINLL